MKPSKKWSNKYKKSINCISVRIYTGEDLKWDTPVGGVISNRYRYRSINELKCPILILQWCKSSMV